MLNKMKVIDLSSVIKENNNKWVAIVPNTNKVIASAKTLKEVLVKSKEKGFSQPAVLKASPVQNLFFG